MSEEEHDKADSNSIYHTLENQIIPAYYNQDQNGVSKEWLVYMKNSIRTTGGKYSTARMVCDYVNYLYMPLCDMGKTYFTDLSKVAEFSSWKKSIKNSWNSIKIVQDRNVDNARFNAGDVITVNCEVTLPNISEENTEVQVYFGQFLDNGTVKNMDVYSMKKIAENKDNNTYDYEAEIDLKTGGNFGYTFRVVPKHEMLVDSENMNLIKWMTK